MRRYYELQRDRDSGSAATRWRWHCLDCGAESFWQDNRRDANDLALKHVPMCGEEVYVTTCRTDFAGMDERGRNAFAEMLRLAVRAAQEGRL